MRRIKTFGLAVVMALALTVLVGAGSASATEFRAEEYPTSVTGTQSGSQHVVKLSEAGGKLTCGKVTMTGTIQEASSSLSLSPSYSSCSIYGLNATVEPKSCKYVFHITKEVSPTFKYTGNMDIACSKEDSIEIKMLGCVVTIPPQTALGSVEFANPEGLRSRNRTITTTLGIAGLKSIETGKPLCTDPGTHENGTYTGSSEIKGENSHAVGIYVANKQVDAPPVFTHEGYGGTITSELQGSMSVKLPGSAEFNCNKFEISAPFPDFATDVLPMSISQWGDCYWGGKFNINTNQCGLTFKLTVSENPYAWGPLDFTCPGGKAFTFTAMFCSYTIPPQANLTGMKFENVGSGATSAILASFEIQGLEYTATGGVCTNPGTHKDASIYGLVKLKGPSSPVPRGIWIK